MNRYTAIPIREWDMLNPFASGPEATSDSPWARSLLDAALARIRGTP